MIYHEFYQNVIKSKYPDKYQDVGIYFKRIFEFYGEQIDIVPESLKFINTLKNHNFNFDNLNRVLIDHIYNTYTDHTYRSLFNFYTKVFINKDYQILYNRFDHFVFSLLERTKNDTNYELNPLLVLFKGYNRIKHELDIFLLLDSNINYVTTTLITSVLIILSWINNKFDPEIVFDKVRNIVLNEDFPEKAAILGIDLEDHSFENVSKLAELIYYDKFNNQRKKVIK